ncbi:MAG: hypothetical protein ACOX2D_07385 [Fermentimonas sp.]
MNGAYLHVGAPVYVGNGATRNLQVAIGFVGNYAPGGLSPQMYDMPVILNNSLQSLAG